MYKIRAVYKAKPNYRFDQDYYVSGHLALARKQQEGKVRIKRIDIERNVKALPGDGDVISPLTVSIYLDTKSDLDAFLQWITTSDAEPLREDAVNYTDCDYEWTVAEMEEFEGY